MREEVDNDLGQSVLSFNPGKFSILTQISKRVLYLFGMLRSLTVKQVIFNNVNRFHNCISNFSS